jgi:hypothetical protein
MKLTANEYGALLRSDFNAFIERSFYELNPTTPFLPNWHIEVIGAELEACRRGETSRLIINIPPRHLKSHGASVASRPGSWVTIRALRSSWQAMPRNCPINYLVTLVLLFLLLSIGICFQLDCHHSVRRCRSLPLRKTVSNGYFRRRRTYGPGCRFHNRR